MLRRLGEGGMGRVHLGRAPDGTLAAVKVIRADLAADREFRARFRQEVELASRVRSPRTVAVLAADPNTAAPWLATEYVPAPSLRDVVGAHGPLPPHALRALATGLAEGLTAVHAAGVTHRDLKPANVLLADDGPRIIDFGIARAADGTVLTRTGALIGTPGFIAPEQITEHAAGPEADVFALGGMLLYAATGRAPFGEGAPAVVLYRVLHGQPDLTGVPAELVALVAACLERDPARRPRPEAVARLDTPVAPPAPAAPRRQRRGVAVTALVAALLVGLAVLLRPAGGPAEEPPVAATSAPPSTQPPSNVAPTPENASATPTAAPTAGAVREFTDPTGFSSPSGNIACLVSPDGARCDIAEHDWGDAQPGRPPDCAGAFGDALAVSGAGRGDFACHGDTVFGSPTLPYGESIRVGDAQCESRENGVECRVGSTRHGFAVSRTRYTLF